MSKPLAIGMDIGGTNLRVALVDSSGNILKKVKRRSEGDILGTAAETASQLIGPDVKGIGIGVAGLIDSGRNSVIISPNIHSIDGRSFEDLGLGLPVHVENDANAAAYGESISGAGREFRNFVMITLGTGVGGGIVWDGALMSIPAEIGHMSIKAEGKSCPCGNRGCLELYCSARAITESVTEALENGAESILKECCKGNIYKITAEDVTKAAYEGDGLAREVLKEAGRNLGIGIANIINLLGPDAVILSGGLTGAWDIMIAEAEVETSKRAMKSLYKKTSIVKALLGDDAGVIGAAGLAMKEFVA